MLRGTFALMAGCLAVSASADTVRRWPDKPAQLACNAGPDSRTIGGQVWLVFACDDGVSIVIVSAEDNPASPFVFSFIKDLLGELRQRGEGNGDKVASKVAYEELRTWTRDSIEQARQRAISAKASAAGDQIANPR